MVNDAHSIRFVILRLVLIWPHKKIPPDKKKGKADRLPLPCLVYTDPVSPFGKPSSIISGALARITSSALCSATTVTSG